MTDLIARLEQATEERQHIPIYDALVYAHEQGWISDKVYDTAQKYRNAGAFLDAALALLPADWHYDLYVEPDSAAAAIYSSGKDSRGNFATAKTAALALCIAALRAREDG